MPYDVSGLLEATWEPVEQHGEQSLWFPVMCLDIFALQGDAVSDYLFGFAKRPCGIACFAGRGLPSDRTPLLELLAQDNDAFIAQHGEGVFGHTYATLHEIDRALGMPEAPSIAGSEWQAVLRTVGQFQLLPQGICREQWRLVVWANW